MADEERREVDRDELVAVQGVDVAVLTPKLGGELDPAAAAEALRLLGDDDLRPDPRQVALEVLALARARTR